jgi:hypothetical protein
MMMSPSLPIEFCHITNNTIESNSYTEERDTKHITNKASEGRRQKKSIYHGVYTFMSAELFRCSALNVAIRPHKRKMEWLALYLFVATLFLAYHTRWSACK